MMNKFSFVKAMILLFPCAAHLKAIPTQILSDTSSIGDLNGFENIDGNNSKDYDVNLDASLWDKKNENQFGAQEAILSFSPPSEEELMIAEDSWILNMNYNPILLPTYISTDIVETAKRNLKLRGYLNRTFETINTLFQNVNKEEEALEATKKRLEEVHSKAKENIAAADFDMRNTFLEERSAIHKSINEYETDRKKEDENDSKAVHGFDKLQNSLASIKTNGNDLMSKITNLMQSLSQLAGCFFNPVACGMELANILLLLL